MFYRCGKLTSIDLSNFSFEKTKDLLSLFVGCRNLEKIVWPSDQKYSSVESIYAMFSGCTKLTSIDLSKFTFRKIKLMYSFFRDCNNLEKIAWPNDEKYSLVENIRNMFYNCGKLTSIDLSNFNFEKTKDMRYLFGIAII